MSASNRPWQNPKGLAQVSADWRYWSGNGRGTHYRSLQRNLQVKSGKHLVTRNGIQGWAALAGEIRRNLHVLQLFESQHVAAESAPVNHAWSDFLMFKYSLWAHWSFMIISTFTSPRSIGVLDLATQKCKLESTVPTAMTQCSYRDWISWAFTCPHLD